MASDESIRTFTNTFSQAFHNKGVDLSPQEHADGRLAAFRQACVNASLLDPGAGSVQYGLIVGNGTGNQWAISFNDEKFDILVHYDIRKKDRWGKRTRKIGYTLSVTVVQECRPMAGVEITREPRHISVSLV